LTVTDNMYGEWGGTARYRVTQITYPVPDLVWAISVWFNTAWNAHGWTLFGG